jgi:hypothetical protein
MITIQTARYATILFGVIIWLSTALATTSLPSAAMLLKEENDWLDQTARLVLAAQGAHADARLFNEDVRASRADLRKIMQKARHMELSPQHRQLHSTMLVLDVLLKSAAACQTGGHIVCPPMLISQLKTVLKNSYAKLDEVRAPSNNVNVSR